MKPGDALPSARNDSRMESNIHPGGSITENSYLKGLKLRGDTLVSNDREDLLQQNISRIV